jgi:hypothetical protein
MVPNSLKGNNESHRSEKPGRLRGSDEYVRGNLGAVYRKDPRVLENRARKCECEDRTDAPLMHAILAEDS